MEKVSDDEDYSLAAIKVGFAATVADGAVEKPKAAKPVLPAEPIATEDDFANKKKAYDNAKALLQKYKEWEYYEATIRPLMDDIAEAFDRVQALFLIEGNPLKIITAVKTNLTVNYKGMSTTLLELWEE